MRLLKKRDCSRWGQAFSLPSGFCPARARPREILWQPNQPRSNRIIFNITPHSPKLVFIADQMIVAFVLPKGLVAAAENPVCFVTGVPLERTQQAGGFHVRCDQQMDVIGHDYVSVQIIAVQTILAIVERLENKLGNFALAQEDRPAPPAVQQAIHRDERLTGRETRRRKHSVVRKASMQAERHKQRLSDDVPVRETAFIPTHACIVPTFGHSSHSFSRRAGRKPGCSPEGLPHKQQCSK